MATPEEKVQFTSWFIDTRTIWPGDKIADSAADALALISEEERQACLRKFRIADAKMSLASALLKRLFVAKTLGTPWHSIRFGRKRDPKHGKPCAELPDGTRLPVEFNVSHQAGLVALVGCKTQFPAHDNGEVEVGVDIVCVNERNDYRVVDEEGFDGWVDVYQEIFNEEESWDMKYNVDPFKLLDGTIVTSEMLGRHDRCCVRNRELVATLPSGEQRKFSSDLLIDAKLRRFYTHWCYKEAYIKLDGEALLANWIRELEFKGVRAPIAGTVARCSTHGSWGERVDSTEVWLKRRKLDDVRMEIRAFEENYMIGVAVKPGNLLPEILTNFKALHLENDVLDFAISA
ncbi:4'-phosphopantetheinyl transferase [Periconia macrospinosa]|uniref:holo-[acyl-carrier-protein] synthase n=1 Tax=Periconia macrospinosa TaxID=97972 RepID=A0A2V1DBG1_9PLEO|nr:4'-phosphopantetheinyl transferase [Periconia macrospinosa]